MNLASRGGVRAETPLASRQMRRLKRIVKQDSIPLSPSEYSSQKQKAEFILQQPDYQTSYPLEVKEILK